MSVAHRTASARPGPPKEPVPPPAPPSPPGWRRWILPLGVALAFVAILFFNPLTKKTSAQNFSYTAFVTEVTTDKVSTATITSTGSVSGKLRGGVAYTSQIPTALGDDALSALLVQHKVQVRGTGPAKSSVLSVLLSLLPFLFIIGVFVWIGRRGARQMGGIGGIMGVGKSKAKVYDEERPSTHFADIAGYEGSKAEVMEVVDFLKHPKRYARAGAVGPKGVLMVGPPGTGKTLLARAVAGEAGVPFFALSGSSFVEMFVGVGASRVRDLFAEARKRAPAIIFIDEIDAIGGRRGPGGFGSNDEREQTLNQLLSDMDGFEPGASVVVMAATNRAEILDAALLRPGRFDRTVEIPLPNRVERTAILAIHGKGKTLAPDVDLDVISRGTPGFSGADLANLVNEAAINAVRDDRSVLSAADFDAARDRLLIGRRDASNALLPEEKHAVAVHEAGHALVAVLSPRADPVAKVTILPRGAALGVTEQLPESERHLYPESHLTDSLAIRLGGRAAEIVVLTEPSTGAANDLLSATELATRMVREWGFSAAVGPISYGPEGPSRDNPFAGRPYAEETQRSIDQEVARLLREAEATATRLISEHLDALHRVIDLLLERETIDGSDLATAIGVPGHVDGYERPSTPRAAAMTSTRTETDGTGNIRN
ncbi:ATP-dependent zinc metalloprotease FtsH [Actinoallomurus bryophytorum]|uniref:ATP-dependent zinc metalloprotease FtsH n=1 Tax=Actinoallomurus bryophytorum TaxID=1490222 RepID=A0A543CJC5_9ACTN|nr:ATP-dependent zinc metalloprotease FtsH [Actinoallomurus bryophytorum]TQL97175.1 cell division protease FtsH [Actinoallomurus bryophytorum]